MAKQNKKLTFRTKYCESCKVTYQNCNHKKTMTHLRIKELIKSKNFESKDLLTLIDLQENLINEYRGYRIYQVNLLHKIKGYCYEIISTISNVVENVIEKKDEVHKTKIKSITKEIAKHKDYISKNKDFIVKQQEKNIINEDLESVHFSDCNESSIAKSDSIEDLSFDSIVHKEGSILENTTSLASKSLDNLANEINIKHPSKICRTKNKRNFKLNKQPVNEKLHQSNLKNENSEIKSRMTTRLKYKLNQGKETNSIPEKHINVTTLKANLETPLKCFKIETPKEKIVPSTSKNKILETPYSCNKSTPKQIESICKKNLLNGKQKKIGIKPKTKASKLEKTKLIKRNKIYDLLTRIIDKNVLLTPTDILKNLNGKKDYRGRRKDFVDKLVNENSLTKLEKFTEKDVKERFVKELRKSI